MLAAIQPASLDHPMPSGYLVVSWSDPGSPTRWHSTEVRIPAGYAGEQAEEAVAIIEAGNGEVIVHEFKWYTA